MLDYLKKLEEKLPLLSLDEASLIDISSAVRACIEDSTLTETVEKFYNGIFTSGKEISRDIVAVTDAYADGKLGEGMIFTVVIFLRALILTENKCYIYDGEPIDFFAPVLRHYGVNQKRNGCHGFVNMQRFWACCYLLPSCFELGRLAFEIMDYNYGYEVWLDPETGKSYPVALPSLRFDERGLPDSEGSFETTLSADGDTLSGYTYTEDGHIDFEMKTFKGLRRVLKQGDKVIAVHMPGSAKLDADAITASLEGAKLFFDKYFPDLDYKAFVSSSWLLDTGLRTLLKEDSNIVKLQKRFRITLAFVNDFSLFDNVFEVPKCPIDELVPLNRFQREILEMIKGGRELYSGRGYILR